MLFKDIAKLTAGLLDREDVAEDIESGAGNAQTKRERALIERCVNLAIAQTASEYAPLRAEAEIYTENGLVEFSALEKNAADLVRVTDRYGNDLAVKYYTDYFKTAPGTIRVEYTYLPDRCAADDEAPLGDRRITASLVAFGAAAEYCLIAGLYDEAAAWNEKYVGGMRRALTGRNKVMKERRWV